MTIGKFLWWHPFEGDGQYCQRWLSSGLTGDPETTGVITMEIQCGYLRDAHLEVLDLLKKISPMEAEE